MIIVALHNQSFLDISIQHTGSVYNAFAIAAANGMAVSENLVPGNNYTIPDTVKNDTDIQNYFWTKSIKPATSFTDLENITERRGIGWMKVATTFKVD